jgi:hypothetical protein
MGGSAAIGSSLIADQGPSGKVGPGEGGRQGAARRDSSPGKAFALGRGEDSSALYAGRSPGVVGALGGRGGGLKV